MTNDDINKQCIYLGPFCQKSNFLDDGSQECVYSSLKNKGYIIQKRSKIIEYLQESSEKEKYLSPLSYPDTNVVASCQNPLCLSCDPNNLGFCVSCWGRFGNPQQSNRCIRELVCSSSPENVKNGCYRTSNDCQICEICKAGYALRTYEGVCESCKSSDEQCKDCTLKNGMTYSCTECEPGWGLDSFGRCQKCTSENVKACKFENGQEKITICDDDWYLSSDGKTCNKKCLDDESQEPKFDSNNKLSVFQCKKCHESCKTCVGGATQFYCSSCFYGNKLDVISSFGVGTCSIKKEAPSYVYKLNVYQEMPESYLEEFDYPDLMSAILQAYRYASPYQEGLKIEITVHPGIHQILKEHVEQFNSAIAHESTIDTDNPTFALTIKAKGEQATILNKVGPSFQIQVPQSLTVDSIIFESEIQEDDEPDTNQICAYRSFDSIFQMKVSDSGPIGTLKSVQQLKVQNSSFKNIFYEIGSIVRLPNPDSGSSWSVEITDSIFENLSFCGSIISNDFPIFEGLQEHDDHLAFRIAQQIQQRMDILYGAPKLRSAYNDPETYSFIFERNTISNLNALKKESLFQAQKVSKNVEIWGLAIHLIDFQGAVSIKDNTFKKTKMQFSDCQNNQQNGIKVLESMIKDTNSWQKHSMIVLESGGEVRVQGNKFEEIQMTNGVIKIKGPEIVMEGNRFEGIETYLGSSVAKIEGNNLIAENLFMGIQAICQMTNLIETKGETEYRGNVVNNTHSGDESLLKFDSEFVQISNSSFDSISKPIVLSSVAKTLSIKSSEFKSITNVIFQQEDPLESVVIESSIFQNVKAQYLTDVGGQIQIKSSKFGGIETEKMFKGQIQEIAIENTTFDGYTSNHFLTLEEIKSFKIKGLNIQNVEIQHNFLFDIKSQLFEVDSLNITNSQNLQGIFSITTDQPARFQGVQITESKFNGTPIVVNQPFTASGCIFRGIESTGIFDIDLTHLQGPLSIVFEDSIFEKITSETLVFSLNTLPLSNLDLTLQNCSFLNNINPSQIPNEFEILEDFNQSAFQLFSFQGQFKSLTLDSNKFQVNSKEFNIQKFDARKGPQVINIFRSEFVDQKAQKVDFQEMVEKYGQLQIAKTYVNSVIFEFLDFHKTVEIEGQMVKQQINFQDIDVKNLTNRLFGAFLTSSNSNLKLSNITAENLGSFQGSFLNIQHKVDEKTFYLENIGIEILIENSNFTNILSQSNGSLIFYDNSEVPRANMDRVVVKNSVISNVYANSGGAFWINCNYFTQVEISGLEVSGAQAITSDSFGMFKKCNNVKIPQNSIERAKMTDYRGGESSYVKIKNSVIKDSLVYFGSSTLTLLSSFLSIEGCHFSNNLPRFLLIDNHFLPSSEAVGISNTLFDQQTSSNPIINGSYIYMSNQNDIGQKPQINIKDCQFKKGRGEFGGAIYVESDVKMVVQNTKFVANQAHKGGAMYFVQLWQHEIVMENVEFVDNQAEQGDDLYIVVDDMVFPSYTQDMGVKLSHVSFTGSNTSQQVYFKNIFNLELRNLVFNPVKNSSALYGGSIFCENCIDFRLYDSSFIGQQSELMGGALFLAQDYGSFPQFYKAIATVPTLSGNTFSSCTSPQGGAILLQNVVNFRILADNNFDSNIAQLADEESYKLTLATAGIPYDDLELDIMQAFIGKGPDIYFDCWKKATKCSLTIENIEIQNSTVWIQKNDTVKEGVPIYYTFQKPVIEDEKRLENIGINSEKMVQLQPDMPLNKLHQQLFNYLLDNQIIYSYEIGTSLFHEFALIDRTNLLQTKDIYTELQVIFSGNFSGKIPFKIRYEGIMDDKISKASDLEYHLVAKKGIFNLEGFKLYGTPGGTFNVLFRVKYFGNGGFDFHTFDIKSKSCSIGQSVSTFGECGECEGPYFYSIVEPKEVQIDPIQCLRCDSNQDAFKCGGGYNLVTQAGYYQLKMAGNRYSDAYVKCDEIAGREVCLKNDECLEGYTGHMCKQCDSGYFKDFDGSCQYCFSQINMITLAIIAIQWGLIILMIFLLFKIIAFYQQTGKMVESFYLLKNLVNYVILFGLLTELFEQSWYTEQMFIIKAYKMVYSLPVQAMNFQCFSKESVGYDWLTLQNSFFLVPITIILMVICYRAKHNNQLMYDLKNPEEQPVQQISIEISDSAEDLEQPEEPIQIVKQVEILPSKLDETKKATFHPSLRQEASNIVVSQQMQSHQPREVSIDEIRLEFESEDRYEGGSDNSDGSIGGNPGINIKPRNNLYGDEHIFTETDGENKRQQIVSPQTHHQYFLDAEIGPEENEDIQPTFRPLNIQNVELESQESRTTMQNKQQPQEPDPTDQPLDSYKVKTSLTKKPLTELNIILIFLLIFHLLFTTQFLEQIIMLFTCQQSELIGNKSKLFAWDLQPLNYYDSSITCITSTPFKMGVQLLVSGLFIVSWIILMPIYAFCKTNAVFKIDLSVQISKVMLIFIRNTAKEEEMRAWGATVVVSALLVMVMSQQVKYDGQTIMKGVLAMSVYLGIAVVLNKDNMLDKQRQHVLNSIIALNLIYILIWLFLFLQTAPSDFKLVFTSQHLYFKNKFTTKYKTKNYKRKETLTFQRKISVKQLDQILQQDEDEEEKKEQYFETEEKKVEVIIEDDSLDFPDLASPVQDKIQPITPDKKLSFIMAQTEDSGGETSNRKLLPDDPQSHRPSFYDPFQHRNGSLYGSILSGSSSPKQTIRANSILVQSFGNFNMNGLEVNEIQAPDSVIVEEDEVDLTQNENDVRAIHQQAQFEIDMLPPLRLQSKSQLKTPGGLQHRAVSSQSCNKDQIKDVQLHKRHKTKIDITPLPENGLMMPKHGHSGSKVVSELNFSAHKHLDEVDISAESKSDFSKSMVEIDLSNDDDVSER